MSVHRNDDDSFRDLVKKLESQLGTGTALKVTYGYSIKMYLYVLGTFLAVIFSWIRQSNIVSCITDGLLSWLRLIHYTFTH